MAEFLDFWRHYADFKGKATVRGFWIAVVIWQAIPMCLMIPLGLFGLFALRLSPEESTNFAKGIIGVYALVSLVPLLSLTVRRLRDAGYSAKSFFWLVVPVFGAFALLARLCTKSKN